MLFIFPVGRTEQHDAIISRLISIKQADSDEREKFIVEYTPFILKTASHVTGKYIDASDSDEFSVALSAFNEAIDCFDTEKGGSFIPFAKLVIKRRLIDFIRRSRKTASEISISQIDEDGSESDNRFFVADSYLQEEIVERRLEIIKFTQTLQDFGITLNEIVNVCPKHKDTRQLCMEISKQIIQNSELRGILFEKKMVPVKALVKECKVSRKTIERHRKYIIAVCIILGGDFDSIKQYIGEV